MRLATTSSWSVLLASRGLGISEEAHLKMRTDGRKAAFHMTDWLGSNGWRFSSDERSGTLLERDGKIYRVRAVTKHGVSFALSSVHGAGRDESFTDEKFEAGAREVDGFLVFLADQLPNAKVWEVSCEEILQWFHNGTLTKKGGRISYEDFLNLVAKARVQEPPAQAIPVPA